MPCCPVRIMLAPRQVIPLTMKPSPVLAPLSNEVSGSCAVQARGSVQTVAQRARRLFFSRAWRVLWALRLGLEIANVTVPTRRTFHSCAAGVWLSVFIVRSQFLFQITFP